MLFYIACLNFKQFHLFCFKRYMLFCMCSTTCFTSLNHSQTKEHPSILIYIYKEDIVQKILDKTPTEIHVVLICFLYIYIYS